MGQGQLRNALNSSARPAAAADRAVPGHPAGDLLLGRATKRDRDARLYARVASPSACDSLTL